MSIIEELSNKTVFELKSYAKAKNIDIYGSKTKLEILEVIASWIPNRCSRDLRPVGWKVTYSYPVTMWVN
jgi:hypothetical protein